tara:strand:+ start:859 stop:1041 length:183 start_codon:yes stop_codon:yes gene_type:complete
MKWNKFYTWFCISLAVMFYFSMVEARLAGDFDKATFELIWAGVWAYLFSQQKTPTETKEP